MRIKNLFKAAVPFITVFLISIPAVLPFLNSGFIATDDGGWMIIRLSAFYDTLRDGQIPARFLERLNFGYGYPVSNFLYPGYLYLGSVIHLLGFGFINTVKILFGLSIIFSGIFSFLWLRRLFGNLDSVIGSLVYVYSPYHLFDIYKRGSLGEALSISVLPLAFYGIERASTILVAISVFSILLFHNSLAVLFLPLIPIYALIRKSFIRSLPGMILGGLVSSFFTIPALYELQYTRFFETQVSNPLEYFAGIELIGISSLAIFISAVVLITIIYKNEIKKVPYFGFIVLFGVIFSLSAFFSSSLSSFVWESINASFIQFPYRLLSLLIVASGFFAAYLSYILFEKVKIIAISLIVILTVFSAYSYFENIEYTNQPEGYYTTNEATTTVRDEYMPVWVEENPDSRPDNKVEVLSGDAEIENLTVKSNLIEFDTEVSTESRIRVNTIYWPGWRVFVEGEEREIDYDNELGVIEFNLEQNDDRVYISFQENLVRIISDIVTILAGLGLIYYIGRPLIKF